MDQLSPPTNPAPSSIRINILWFLSLGLSLTASLLAIIVQQWLREYRLPGHLSTRERVRLRQLRYEALFDWSVPGIVSLLPVLLQAALILFLTGLSYLLFTLDKTAAIAFVSFVGIAMSAYFAFVVLPILYHRSPYRNPLSHALLSIAKVLAWAAHLVYLVAVWVGFVVTCIVLWLVETCYKLPAAVHNAAGHKLESMVGATKLALSRRYNPVGGRNLWRERDIVQLSTAAEVFDCNALAWAPSAVPTSKLSTLDQCLQDLPQDRRIECVMKWISGALHVDVSSFDLGPKGKKDDCCNVLDSAANFDATFIARFKGCLLSVLPTRFYLDDAGSRFDYTALVMLYQFARGGATVDVGFRRAFARRLVDIVAAQAPRDFKHRWARVPSICLQDLMQMHGYRYTRNGIVIPLPLPTHSLTRHTASSDLTIFVDHVLRVHDTATVMLRNDAPEIIMVLHAVPLHAFALQPTSLLHDAELRRKCRDMLIKLDAFLLVEWFWVCDAGQQNSDHYRDGVPLEMVPTTRILCSSIATLAEASALPLPFESEDSKELTVASFLDHVIDVLGTVSEEVVQCLLRLRAGPTPPETTTTQADAATHQPLPLPLDDSEISAHRDLEEQLKDITASRSAP